MIAGACSWLLFSAGQMNAQVLVPIQNSTFDSGSGQIAGQFTLAAGSSNVGPQALGTSGWYGRANSATLTVVVPVAGFRPGIAVDTGAASENVAEIHYDFGLSLGGLAGLEMPEATLWQPLTGFSMQPNSTYRLTVNVDAGALLNLSALSSRGFGIGVSTGASTSGIGTMYADSLQNPNLLGVILLGGNDQQLELAFTTGASVPTGNLGVVVFAGRGTQTIEASVLSNFKIDNASLTVVPEPHVALLAGLGLLVLFQRRLFRRQRARG